MKVLLVQNSTYFGSYAGAEKSDRLLMSALAGRGYDCSVLARLTHTTHREYLRQLVDSGLKPASRGLGEVQFTLDSVAVRTLSNGDIRSRALRDVHNCRPDIVLVSTDPSNTLITCLAGVEVSRVIYLVRTTVLLPFGPDAMFPSMVRTEAVRRASAVLAVSRYAADYVRQHAGISAIHVPMQLMEPGEWPCLGDFDNPCVTMVNPCASKGISIFVGLIDLFPEVQFAAVPTWGTSADDMSELVARPNIRCLDPTEDIRDILRLTRVTLVPSLWPEARSRMVVESMLAGVPVLASDLGGMREAAMGIPCLIPVNPIKAYRRQLNNRMIRMPEVPRQDLKTWISALSRLITDREHYSRASRQARTAAGEYAAHLNTVDFESVLDRVVRFPC